MSKKNRDTLKNFFQKGALPSEEHFRDLIDSSLNMIDEGFSRSPTNGVEITPHGDHDTLISFFQGRDPVRPTWSVSHDRDKDKLLFNPRKDDDTTPSPSLTLDPEGRVGVNNKDPEWDLDVRGVVRSEGRIGGNPAGETWVPADGKWHNITDPLTGCHAFEVMAGVGKKKTGRYALMHAFALNTFNPKGFFFNFLNLKKRIHYHQAYYISLSAKLKLRWHEKDKKYFLQLRSNTDYGDGIRIRFYITKLWFDDDMGESWRERDTDI